MNEFQSTAISRLEPVLKDLFGTSEEFKEVRSTGKISFLERILMALFGGSAPKASDSYFTATFVSQKKTYQLYIYPDEIGVMINEKDWRISEKEDFSSQDELIEGFISKLSRLAKAT